MTKPDRNLLAGSGYSNPFSSIKEGIAEEVLAMTDMQRLSSAAMVIDKVWEHAREGGSFRYLIYERLGLSSAAYLPLCSESQAMNISNEFVVASEVNLDSNRNILGYIMEMVKASPVVYVGREGSSIRIPSKQRDSLFNLYCYLHTVFEQLNESAKGIDTLALEYQESVLAELTRRSGDVSEEEVNLIKENLKKEWEGMTEDQRISGAAWAFNHIWDQIQEGGSLRYFTYVRMGLKAGAFNALCRASSMFDLFTRTTVSVKDNPTEELSYLAALAKEAPMVDHSSITRFDGKPMQVPSEARSKLFDIYWFVDNAMIKLASAESVVRRLRADCMLQRIKPD